MSSESLNKFLGRIREQVIAHEVDGALDELRSYVAGAAPRLSNDLSLIANRYYRLQRDERKGITTREVAQAELTKLVQDLLSVIDEVPLHVTREMSPVASPEPQSSQPAPSQPATSQPSTSAPGPSQLESLLHVNVLKQISWIQRAIEVARSVCRVMTPDGVGTGFLIGPWTLMTNNHVIRTAALAEQSLVEFNYEQDLSGRFLQTTRYRLNSEVFHTSTALDYTIVGIKSDSNLPQLETWGTLDLNPFADPVPSEHVVIIQHPNGGLKQIAMTANQVVKVEPPHILYTTDTMQGSSGAPVFNDQWQVIAIHHAGAAEKNPARKFTNEGVLMSAIKADAGNYWP
jgi:V8-like Glu-specific endopeptidase